MECQIALAGNQQAVATASAQASALNTCIAQAVASASASSSASNGKTVHAVKVSGSRSAAVHCSKDVHMRQHIDPAHAAPVSCTGRICTEPSESVFWCMMWCLMSICSVLPYEHAATLHSLCYPVMLRYLHTWQAKLIVPQRLTNITVSAGHAWPHNFCQRLVVDNMLSTSACATAL